MEELKDFESPLTIKLNRVPSEANSNVMERASFAASVANELKAPEHGERVSKPAAHTVQKSKENDNPQTIFS